MVDDAFVAGLLRRIEELETRLRHVEAYRAKLVRENRRLRQHDQILQEQVRELTARLNQDSSNSSKPPSSERPWRERRSQPPTGRSRGAQPGHVGTTRAPFPPEQVDRERPVFPKSCANRGRRLGPEDIIAESLAY
ncbi:MAG: DUF6444 domain-containing protein [Planctomycetaceae bacterium]